MKTPQIDALPGMTPLGIKPQPRSLKKIAHDIARCWVNMYFGAKPYVLAM